MRLVRRIVGLIEIAAGLVGAALLIATFDTMAISTSGSSTGSAFFDLGLFGLAAIPILILGGILLLAGPNSIVQS